eukprot:753627-Hanusia_phi.AAC.1
MKVGGVSGGRRKGKETIERSGVLRRSVQDQTIQEVRREREEERRRTRRKVESGGRESRHGAVHLNLSGRSSPAS